MDQINKELNLRKSVFIKKKMMKTQSLKFIKDNFEFLSHNIPYCRLLYINHNLLFRPCFIRVLDCITFWWEFIAKIWISNCFLMAILGHTFRSIGPHMICTWISCLEIHMEQRAYIWNSRNFDVVLIWNSYTVHPRLSHVNYDIWKIWHGENNMTLLYLVKLTLNVRFSF